MCRDQNLISETDGRTYGRTTDERMKIEKRDVGRPLLGPAKNIYLKGWTNISFGGQQVTLVPIVLVLFGVLFPKTASKTASVEQCIMVTFHQTKLNY